MHTLHIYYIHTYSHIYTTYMPHIYQIHTHSHTHTTYITHTIYIPYTYTIQSHIYTHHIYTICKHTSSHTRTTHTQYKGHCTLIFPGQNTKVQRSEAVLTKISQLESCKSLTHWHDCDFQISFCDNTVIIQPQGTSAFPFTLASCQVLVSQI